MQELLRHIKDKVTQRIRRAPKISTPDLNRLPARSWKPFITRAPQSLAGWEKQRNRLRSKLIEYLGERPSLFVPKATVHETKKTQRYTLEKFSFENGIGHTVYGDILVPTDGNLLMPAVLYNHCHGGKYHYGRKELFFKRYSNRKGGHKLIIGEELTKKGYVVLAIDAYGFGERLKEGSETSLFKIFLWQGRVLWGMMVHDDQLALKYLMSRPEVDPTRIATMGFSMGATRSWWLAALQDDINVAISAGCLTRYQDLIFHHGENEHSLYYYVPGILKGRIDSESIVGLIAPRAHLTLTGDCDAGSPVEGVRIINKFQENLYRLYDCRENFKGIIYENTGHVFKHDMWKQAILWLDSKLG